MPDITQAELANLRRQFQPLIGVQFTSLALPAAALEAFEPSQIGTIVGALMDAMIPHVPDLRKIGLQKHGGLQKDREGYPDYKHESGKRLELKLLYVHNPAVKMKVPATPREPSARLTQKVTRKNVNPADDAVLLVAYRMEQHAGAPDAVSPTIKDVAVLSMIELITARDKRMEACGGRWFGNFETPTVPSKIGRAKLRRGEPPLASYGRKESEGMDYNEDTNFGKLRRIPHKPLQQFLDRYRGKGEVKDETFVEAVEEMAAAVDELTEGKK